MVNRCRSCYYYEICKEEDECMDYTPVDSDTEINDLIERNRLEFRSAWFEYVSEYED